VSTSAGTPEPPDNGRPPADGTRRKDLRDGLWGRALILGVLLVITLLVSKTCASNQNEISQQEAVAIAKQHVDFTPDDYQIRYVPQGVPPVYFWAVSLYNERNGQPTRVQVVLVNATTGAVQP
jgi:hypothetical protein